jgi:hypothetical protein
MAWTSGDGLEADRAVASPRTTKLRRMEFRCTGLVYGMAEESTGLELNCAAFYKPQSSGKGQDPSVLQLACAIHALSTRILPLPGRSEATAFFDGPK